MKIEQDGKNTVVQKNSKFKFIDCLNEDGKTFLPLFTDWKEATIWYIEPRRNIDAFVMNTFEAFEFAKSAENYNGIVINPGSKPWTMNIEQVNNFLEAGLLIITTMKSKKGLFPSVNNHSNY